MILGRVKDSVRGRGGLFHRRGVFWIHRRFRSGSILDDGVLVEVENDDLTIIQAEFPPVEPESIIFGMGVPRPGLGLSEPRYDAFDGVRPHLITVRNLLGHANALAGLVNRGLKGHGWNRSRIPSHGVAEAGPRRRSAQDRYLIPCEAGAAILQDPRFAGQDIDEEDRAGGLLYLK